MTRVKCMIAAALFGASMLPPASAQWSAGVAEVKITPPLGTRMAGFSARKGTAQSVHDDLFVRALVVSREKDAIALVTSDLIGFDKEVVTEIRKQAEQATGIPAARILVSAIHTHSGPEVRGDYRGFFIRSAADAITQAWRSRHPALIGAGKATYHGWVGMNRRHLESGFSPIDKDVAVLKMCDARGRLEAVLYNYSCHPACLGPDSLAISADWPYFVSERIKAKVGTGVKVMFFQGTEGNVNTGYSAGLSAIGVPIATRNFDYASQVGGILADGILAKLPGIAVQKDGALESRDDRVPLEYYVPSTLEQAEAQLADAQKQVAELERASAPLVRIQAARVAQAFAEYNRSRIQRNLKAHAKEPQYPAEIQAFRIGDAGLVSFPGEFFVEIGLAVKRRSPFPVTFCLGLANDGVGYVPTADYYPEGGYEVSVARFGPRSAQAWEDAATRLLTALK